MNNDKLELIKIEYFKNLSDESLGAILQFCTRKTFHKGTVIFNEGDIGDSFFLLVSGAIEIWKNDGKHDRNLVAIQGPGSFFGEMALIDEQPRSATVIACDTVVSFRMSRHDFLDLIQNNGDFALSIMKSMSSVIRNSTEKLFANINAKSKMLQHETEVRKISESALKESEEKFRILAENVSDILWIIDYKNDIFTYVSPAVEKVIGYKPSELIKKSWHIITTPRFLKSSKSLYDGIHTAKTDTNKHALHTIEVEALHRTGQIVWLETSFHFLRNSDGIIMNTLGVSRDVTKRKLMEKKLDETRALFLAALDQSSAGVILSDASGMHVQLVNGEAENVLGMSKHEITHTPISQLAEKRLMYVDGTPYTHEFPIIRAVMEGRVINEEVLINTSDTIKKKWLLINAAPIRNTDGEIIAGIAVFSDITKNKELENKTREFGNKFQQARKMESVATLAGGIAHEFNNALFEITGNIELLQMNLDDRGQLENYSKKIKNSAFRMANLNKKLLAYSRGGKYQPVLSYLNDIVKKIIPDPGYSIKPNVTITIEEMSDSYKIKADVTQLKMAISSIITNAIESIDEYGEVRVKTYIFEADEMYCENHPGLTPATYSCMTIKDNGRGMPVNTVNKIFEPFFTTNFPGRGLGMAAVYGIVKNHNGWIGVESKQGEGTTVTVLIPIDQDKSPPTGTSNFKCFPLGQKNNVLIVEDKTAVLAVNKEMFEYLGYGTREAKTGKEALVILSHSSQTIGLAVLDFDLPDMKCETLYKKIKEIAPDLNILISTGFPVDEVANALKIDQSHVILKPYSLSTLSLKLKENISTTTTNKQ